MVNFQDACTLTDVCISQDLPEVELISLISESLPKYKLRADKATEFTSYNHCDWGIQEPPLIKAQDLQLTPEQIEEVLKYFVLSGKRLSQMTKVYDDIEVVAHLLEEKEKDLELAALIGQSLLEQNKQLNAKCEKLEQEIIVYQEQTEQLKHDLAQKDQLLQLLANEDQVDHHQQIPVVPEKTNSKYVEVIQRKLSSLEEENSLLRVELSQLYEQTQRLEEHEQMLAKDCIHHLNDAQKRIKVLQAEVDSKGQELIKCQEECSRAIQQLVNNQQKTKELTIENLDMKETLKASNEVQKELVSELFEMKEKHTECQQLLDAAHNEIKLLKLNSSPKVTTQKYYSSSYIHPPAGSLAAELESLQHGDRHITRANNSKVMETANYIRKLSSKSPSLNSSMTSNSSSKTSKPGKNPLLAIPIPGSQKIKAAASTAPAPTLSHTTESVKSTPKTISSVSSMTSSFYDEIEKHRQSFGRPGIPGSKDLDAALKRLSLRRQNEKSEQDFNKKDNYVEPELDQMGDNHEKMDWSASNSPTLRSPSPESELSGYGSASSFGYRMPEKLQIVKPIEGSATLHHWQRLATPNLAGIFEDRDGIHIKHGKPLADNDSTTYSLLDVEEDVVPIRCFNLTLPTNTVTDARVLHPSTTYQFNAPSKPLSTLTSNTAVTTTSSSSGLRYGIVSKLGNVPSGAGMTGLFDLPSSPPKSSQTYMPIKSSGNIVTEGQKDIITAARNFDLNAKPTTSKQSESASVKQPFGILSSVFQYFSPGEATKTTQSGLTSIVSHQFGSQSTNTISGTYGRWQSPW